MSAAKKLEQATRLRKIADGIEHGDAELPDDIFEEIEDLLEATRVLNDPTEERIPHADVLARLG